MRKEMEYALQRVIDANPTVKELLEFAGVTRGRRNRVYTVEILNHVTAPPKRNTPYGLTAVCQVCSARIDSPCFNPAMARWSDRPEFQRHVNYHNDIERQIRDAQRCCPDPAPKAGRHVAGPPESAGTL